MVYKLDKTSIDFGLQQYDRIEDKEMFIFNTGKVPVTFSVLMASLSRSNVLEVLPGSGRIAAGDKQRLAIRLLPGLPTKLREAFHVQVAHFEPEEVVVTAEGIYPRIAINLPRDETDAFTVSSIVYPRRGSRGRGVVGVGFLHRIGRSVARSKWGPLSRT